MPIVSYYTLAQASDAPAAAPTGAPPQASFLGQMLPFVAMMVILWVLMIRPQQKRARELAAKIAALKTGDKVITSGGIHGVVTNVKEGSSLTLKVDDECKMTVEKSSIATILSKEE